MSGTYYPLGVAMAKMWSAAGIGLNVGAEATGGSVENARHIKSKTMEVGFVESLIADWAYKGQEMFKDAKVDEHPRVDLPLPQHDSDGGQGRFRHQEPMPI